MRSRKVVVALLAALFITSSALSVESSKKQMTKEELGSHIKELLDSRDDVAGLIPDLKKETNPSGNSYYLYKGVRLDDMDKGQLQKFLNTINGEIARINNERLQKQLESIRQADQAIRASQQASRQVNIPRPVPTPPKTPAPPPAPPRR